MAEAKKYTVLSPLHHDNQPYAVDDSVLLTEAQAAPLLRVQAIALVAEEPAVTPEPVVLVEPAVTSEPVVPVEPAVTPEPVVLVEPAVTSEPVVPVEPAVTPEPVVPAEPPKQVAASKKAGK